MGKKRMKRGKKKDRKMISHFYLDELKGVKKIDRIIIIIIIIIII